MPISRRNFFRFSIMPALATLIPVASIAGQTFDAPVRRGAKTLNYRDFRDQIGSKFTVSDGIFAREAILTDVESLEQSNENQDNALFDPKCFSLTFKLVTTFAGSQATYDIRHRKLGEFQLMMVPGELSLNQPLLIAIINRSH